MTMRAVVIERLGNPPSTRQMPRAGAAAGEAIVRIDGAAVNPVDVAVASGAFYGMQPDPPYIPGVEGAGTVEQSEAVPVGTPVWLYGAGLGMSRPGALAEYVTVGDDALIPLPKGSDLAIAAALGIPAVTGWLAVRWRAELQAGESVLVLGGSGAVGIASIQAARTGGAGRVVAAGRSVAGLDTARRAGADAVVRLHGDAAAMETALAEACGADPPKVIIDPLCGPPLEAAVGMAAPDARLVQLGQSAGPAAELRSADIRGKGLDLRGLSVFRVPRHIAGEAIAEMLAQAASGDWQTPHERIGFDELADTWSKLDMQGSGLRIVVTPTQDLCR